ncbi:MAG: alpha/beta hydrolase [Chloroflexi bacterium]|nr:alpha/beta hydrolase [Chloroflexota bacterium]
MGKHFVLIHGAWHGGWCWEGIIQELERAGHTAEAPTMPGHNPSDQRAGITLDHYVQAIAAVLNRQTQPVILVGHSSAGFLLQVSAPCAPQKIERLVFHNAFILPEGKSQFDLVPPEAAQGMTMAANASPDQSVPVIEDFVRSALMAGESVEMQNALIARLVPQPLALFTTPVSSQAFSLLTIPKSVLFCRDDASLPPGAFLGMAQALGEFKLAEIPGGHESLFTNPSAVAKGLLEII